MAISLAIPGLGYKLKRFSPIFVTVLVLSLFAVVRADKITLKDGTVLEGRTIKQSGGYWIKLADGSTQTVSNDDIATVERSVPPASSDTGGSIGVGAQPGGSASLEVTKHKADAVDAPMAAVAIWQQFIDSKPSDEDLKVADQEMANWKKLADEGAERIRGKWIGGEEKKALLEKVAELQRQYIDLIKANETLAAVKKLQEAYALYPNSYHITFALGYLSLLEKEQDKAIQYFEQTLKLKPDLAPAMGNIGIALIGKNKLAEGLLKLEQAAQDGDSPELAHDLALGITHLTEVQRDSDRLKPVIDTSSLLQSKYARFSAAFPPDKYMLIPLRERPTDGQQEAGAGKMWCGTGFLVSKDGLVLTNRHVARDAKTLMVTLDGGVQTTAKVVTIDDEQDLALLRIDPDVAKGSFVKFAPADTPAAGADCTVMGFPLLDRLGSNIKITRGIVTGIQQADLDADVLIDAKVNPGNSGGPILDRFGNVMAIVSMKTLSSTSEDTYGIGISAGHIRKFLDKNHVTVESDGETGSALTTEQIVAKIRPATVLIFATE